MGLAMDARRRRHPCKAPTLRCRRCLARFLACLRPTPGGGAGTLTVIDNRTGKKYEISVSDHGTIKATDLKQITAGGDGVGLRTFDNG